MDRGRYEGGELLHEAVLGGVWGGVRGETAGRGALKGILGRESKQRC